MEQRLHSKGKTSRDDAGNNGHHMQKKKKMNPDTSLRFLTNTDSKWITDINEECKLQNS